MTKNFSFSHHPTLAWVTLIVVFTSCEMPDKPATTATTEQIEMDVFSKPKGSVGLFSAGIEKAHHIAQYREHKNIQFDITRTFDDRGPLQATITMSTTTNQTKVETQGETFYLNADGSSAFSEDTLIQDRDGFSYFLWAHFFSLPERLREKNLLVEDFDGEKKIDDVSYKVRKLEFEEPEVKEPFKFYVLYVDKDLGLIRFAAYGLDDELAKSIDTKPHLIEFAAYQEIDGIPISTEWRFWHWSMSGGIGKQLGEASLSNVKFVEVEEGFYDPATEVVSNR